MASVTLSKANVVAFGATLLPSASYDYKGFLTAVRQKTVVFPCLMAILDLSQQKGMQEIAVQGNAAQIEFRIEHYYLFSKVAGVEDFSIIDPLVTTALDNYIVALKANPYFAVNGVNGTHYSPTSTYEIAKSVWSGEQYHSIIFRHDMKLNL